MSAIECKIIICGSNNLASSQAVCSLAPEIAKDPELSKEVIELSEKYNKKIHKLLGKLTNG